MCVSKFNSIQSNPIEQLQLQRRLLQTSITKNFFFFVNLKYEIF